MKCLQRIKDGWRQYMLSPKQIKQLIRSKTDQQLIDQFNEYRFIQIEHTPYGFTARCLIQEIKRRKLLCDG